MAIPATGTSWRAGGFGDVDSRFNTRGGLAAVLIRDNRGADTNISPWAAGNPPTRNWSPFADDGTPRDDLFAHILVDGDWITNPEPNEGFHLIGALTEDGGPERAPDITNDNQMILQSNMPFDSDLTGEGLTINFTGVETVKPLMKRLRMNLVLADSSGNSIVEDPGTENFVIGKPIDTEAPEYQIHRRGLQPVQADRHRIVPPVQDRPRRRLARVSGASRSVLHRQGPQRSDIE
jgi:hypothetical protein